ncbi:MAG: barstar family protein [Pseudomonadota bacterium]
MKLEEILSFCPPYCVNFSVDDDTALHRVYDLSCDDSWQIFVLDSTRMRSRYRLLEEIAARLEFPFFGRNIPALEDCLTDMSWNYSDGILVVYLSSESLLEEEEDDEIDIFLNIINYVNEYWKDVKFDSIDHLRGKLIFKHIFVNAQGALKSRLHNNIS